MHILIFSTRSVKCVGCFSSAGRTVRTLRAVLRKLTFPASDDTLAYVLYVLLYILFVLRVLLEKARVLNPAVIRLQKALSRNPVKEGFISHAHF